MRVLYFLAHPDTVGGAARQMIAQATVMQKRGHTVCLVIQSNEDGSYNSEYDRLCKQDDLEHLTCFFPIATCIERINIIKCEDVCDDIERLIVNYNPDLIHSLQLNTAVEFVARKRGIPHVFSIYPVSDGMFNIKWEDVFPGYHICDSVFYSRQWKNGLDIDSRCIRVIYDNKGLNSLRGCEESHYYDGEGLRLINIAHFSPHKRQLEILRFIRLCRDKDIKVHMRFLGDYLGEYGDECKKYVSDNLMDDMVSFDGFVENVCDYLRHSDLMILASTTESFPGVIVEAMANRTPILSTPVAGVPELLSNGVNAFISEDYSSDSIFNSFIYYIDAVHDKILEGIVDKAYETYLSNHTPESVGPRLEEYYNYIYKSFFERDKKVYNISLMSELRRFYEERRLSDYSEYTRDHCWYLYHLSKTLEYGATVYVWGAGRFGVIGIEWSKVLGLVIKGFLDSGVKDKFQGYDVESPTEELIKEADYIIVAVAKSDYVEQIMIQLKEYGLKRNKNYFLVSNDPCYRNNS